MYLFCSTFLEQELTRFKKEQAQFSSLRWHWKLRSLNHCNTSEEKRQNRHRLNWSYENVPWSQYAKLSRYFRTSSSVKWAKRSINLIFHLFIQFRRKKLLFSHWNWINRWKIEFIDLFAHLEELEVLKYLPSFPYCHCIASIFWGKVCSLNKYYDNSTFFCSVFMLNCNITIFALLEYVVG